MRWKRGDQLVLARPINQGWEAVLEDSFEQPVSSRSTVSRILKDTREHYRRWCKRRLEEHDLVYLFPHAVVALGQLCGDVPEGMHGAALLVGVRPQLAGDNHCRLPDRLPVGDGRDRV